MKRGVRQKKKIFSGTESNLMMSSASGNMGINCFCCISFSSQLLSQLCCEGGICSIRSKWSPSFHETYSILSSLTVFVYTSWEPGFRTVTSYGQQHRKEWTVISSFVPFVTLRSSSWKLAYTQHHCWQSVNLVDIFSTAELSCYKNLTLLYLSLNGGLLLDYLPKCESKMFAHL